jgi:hypothetical protein
VASPVIAAIDLFASFAFFTFDFAAIIAGLLSPGAIPDKANDFLSFPDCMFHIRISPVVVPAKPKLPQAVTQTAWGDALISDPVRTAGTKQDTPVQSLLPARKSIYPSSYPGLSMFGQQYLPHEL